MRSPALALCAIGLAAFATAARGQSLASRIDRVRDGEVRLSFATRSNVCGNGRFIGVDRADGFWMYSSWEDGFSTQVLRDVRPSCAAGPLRLVVVKTGGRVTELRAAVGVQWRERASATDLGLVSAPEAADWLVGLLESGQEGVARMALLSACVADGSRVTGRVLAVARDRQASRGVREQALRWLQAIATAEDRADEADRALRAMAADETEAVSLRERSIRSLGSSPANHAYLQSLYGRIDEATLKERIIREIASRGSDADASWVRDVALNAREAVGLRDRALRVLGEELGRAGDVRNLYAKLDREALRERALRVVAERDQAGTTAWLRQVAGNTEEALGLRDRAIRLLAERNRLADLEELYSTLDRIELRDRVLRSAAESGAPEAAGWLTTIVLDRTESRDLRDRAVRELADRGVPSSELASLYDRVDASALKQRLVRVLAQRADDDAIRKLSAIAANDPDPSLRREASRRLGEKTRSP